MKNVTELLNHISLEPIEENIFRGKSHSVGAKNVFGGQVLSQALEAAMLTVPEDRHVHSLHAYFILPGDTTKPIVYEVDRIRDGRSFMTRRVVAIQAGRPVFNLSASFQRAEEGFDHQISMYNVHQPDTLMSDKDMLAHYRDQLPAPVVRFLELPRPIEFRRVERPNLFNPQKERPARHVWMRAKGKMSDDIREHQRVLAYASDYNLLTTALRPHGVHIMQLQMASLDHAMWFHRDFRMDEWLLYAMDSPSASNSRGFTRGSVFNLDGKLVASVVQEGLIRMRRK